METRTRPHGPVGTCGMMFRQDSMSWEGVGAQKRQSSERGGHFIDVEFDGP